MGLLRGKATVPVDRMAVAGLATFKVAPNGKRYVRALVRTKVSEQQGIKAMPKFHLFQATLRDVSSFLGRI